MAVGILVECGCPILMFFNTLQSESHRESSDQASRALGSKPDLIEGCGTAAKIFLETGCDSCNHRLGSASLLMAANETEEA